MTSSITSSWCAKSIRRSQSSLSDTRWWVELLQMKFFLPPTRVSGIDRHLLFMFVFVQGGMILLSAALKEPTAFDGVVLMGPLIHIDPNLASPVKLWAARLLSRVTPHLAVVPHLFLSILRGEFWPAVLFFQVSKLTVEHITSDQGEQELIKNDPLVWKGGVKCKWATATHECLVVNSFNRFYFNRHCVSHSVGFVIAGN